MGEGWRDMWRDREEGRSRAAANYTYSHTGRQRRQAALMVEQAVVSQRAMRHAAWGAKKQIRSQLQVIKKSPYKVQMRPLLQTTPTSQGPQKPAEKKLGGTSKRERKLVTPATPPPSANKSPISPPVAGKPSVLATPQGFRKIREASRQPATPTSKTTPTPKPDPLLWKIGEDYGTFEAIVANEVVKGSVLSSVSSAVAVIARARG